MLSISIGQGRGFEEEVDGGETGIYNGLESVEIVGGGGGGYGKGTPEVEGEILLLCLRFPF